MNKTGRGRWGRYKQDKGELHKLCNGPLHGEEGAWLPLRSFFTYKSGQRAGKPFSRCIACEKINRGRDPNLSGLVEVDRVYFVFIELQRRIGKAETCRRLGLSQNLWIRLENRTYRRMYRRTARNAMLLLKELREQEVVLHRDSIKHGSIARGKEPKRPATREDFYDRSYDEEKEFDRKRKKLTRS